MRKEQTNKGFSHQQLALGVSILVYAKFINLRDYPFVTFYLNISFNKKRGMATVETPKHGEIGFIESLPQHLIATGLLLRSHF